VPPCIQLNEYVFQFGVNQEVFMKGFMKAFELALEEWKGAQQLLGHHL